MFCNKCNNDTNFEIKIEEEIIKVKEEEIKLNCKITYCKNCGEQVWNDELDNDNLKKAYAIYKKHHNLLLPEEITEIRQTYGLTQTTYAKILGLGEKTIARYENGSIQDMAQNNLILLSKNIDNLKILYNQQKSKLDPQEIEKMEILFKNYIYKK